ncbi:MAG: VIT1/CCC1 transporter family protein [bacterium]
MKQQQKFIDGLLQAWRDEMVSAKNYRALAEREQNDRRKAILERMAKAEERHASRWAQRLKELNVQVPEYAESMNEKIHRWIIMRSDAESAAKMLEEAESAADTLYETLLASAPNDEDRAALHEVKLEENTHSKMLEEFAGSHQPSFVQSRLEHILGRERWHVRAGGWFGQAIYGANDGLGAAFGVVSGVAGATQANSEFVLLSGIAAAIASALSMGSGAYLATKSEREVYEAEIEKERREIEESPEEEIEEMELFYQLKGFSPEQAKLLAAKLAEQPDHLLKALAHEELGLSEQSFPNQWRSAMSATISTAIGAIIPVLPFLFSTGQTALLLSFIVSTLAHFLVGASKVFVTGRSWMKSGIEMTLVGLGAALITYAVGMLIAPIIE